MQTRRKFFTLFTTALVAVAFVAGSAFADELLGVLTKVDVEGKKVTVVEKGTDKEVVVTVTDKTETVGKNGAQPLDLSKLETRVKKTQEKGGKGVQVKVEHEKGVASKITPVAGKKKAATN
jgi:maltodextrin utilization protein YvdJ